MSRKNMIVAAVGAVVLVLILAAVLTRRPEEPASSAAQPESAAPAMSESQSEPAESEETGSGTGTTAGGTSAVPAGPQEAVFVTPVPEGAEQHHHEEPVYAELPYTIPDSGLVIESVNSYDGIFLEDGSDSEISGVASLVLKNTGSRCVDYAKIQMDGVQTAFTFEISGLEPGASMVALEMNKAPAVEQLYHSVSADVAQVDRFELSEELLKVEETEEGKLRVTNQSDREIPCARVFYKFYMPEENVYVGGITYVVKATGLKPGESAEVAPSHYASGSSRVIMAKVYDTDAE